MQPPDIEQHQGGAAQGHEHKPRLRVYQQWQGHERFFCWGFLVGGPNWKASLGSAALIAAPGGVYIAFVGVYMAIHVHVIILVIGCILPLLSVLFLMITACIDPGIIPRQEPDAEYLSGQKPRTKEVYVNNQRVLIRYNDTCHFYQPPRAHHCSVNDNCIERFDHHCPWVGTTIGLRNYRTFLLFVYVTTVLCLYVFGVCLAQIFVKHDELVDEAQAANRSTSNLWGKTLGKTPAAIALMAYTFLFFWFVGGLSVFHAYLVGSNQTTYENFRYNHDNRPNPYSRGLLRNCAEVWCSRIPPSKVRFRAFVDEVQPPTGQPGSPYLDAAQVSSLQGEPPPQQSISQTSQDAAAQPPYPYYAPPANDARADAAQQQPYYADNHLYNNQPPGMLPVSSAAGFSSGVDGSHGARGGGGYGYAAQQQQPLGHYQQQQQQQQPRWPGSQGSPAPSYLAHGEAPLYGMDSDPPARDMPARARAEGAFSHAASPMATRQDEHDEEGDEYGYEYDARHQQPYNPQQQFNYQGGVGSEGVQLRGPL